MPMFMTFFIGCPYSPATGRSEPGRKNRHPVQHRVDIGNHVTTVYRNRRGPGGAQGRVQHCPIFGEVYLLTPEHGVTPGFQAALAGKAHQQGQGFGRNSILGIIEEDGCAFRAKAFTPGWVFGKELPQVARAHLFVMRLEGLPCDAFSWVLGYRSSLFPFF